MIKTGNNIVIIGSDTITETYSPLVMILYRSTMYTPLYIYRDTITILRSSYYTHTYKSTH